MDVHQQTPPGSGSCVNCSRPDNADNMVQCDHCDNWWHMGCAAVSSSVADRPWSCRNCIPSSVSSRTSSKAARIALRLQQLDEERAIQQREREIEQKAIEQEKQRLQEKYSLLQEQLSEEREQESRRSQISRRESLNRVQQWVESNAVASANADCEIVAGAGVEANQDGSGNKTTSHGVTEKPPQKQVPTVATSRIVQTSDVSTNRPVISTNQPRNDFQNGSEE